MLDEELREERSVEEELRDSMDELRFVIKLLLGLVSLVVGVVLGRMIVGDV